MKKIIGYVGNRDIAAIREEDIRCLDVINIAFGSLHEGRIEWNNPEGKEAVERIHRVDPSTKVVLSVGGWSVDGFSQAARTAESRELFAKTGAAVAAEYGLDGIDIDWEYPGMSVAGIESDDDDFENFPLMLKALREELGEGRLLTIAAGGDAYSVRNINVEETAKYLDYVQLMTYDLQGGFQTVTGHHSALYLGRRNLFDSCVDKVAKVWLQAGVPSEKLIAGIPFYSRKWEGVNPVKGAETGLGLPAGSVGGYGPSYSELLEEYVGKKGFVRYWDDVAKAPYLYDGSTFITYEDKESMAAKVDYVKANNLGGVMYWEYQCDSTQTLTEFLRGEMDK